METWNLYLITVENNRQFVDCKLLEEFTGKELRNKFNRMVNIVKDIIVGSSVKPEDLVRRIPKRSQSKDSVCIAVAAGVMQLILLHGFKELPWTEPRRYVFSISISVYQ